MHKEEGRPRLDPHPSNSLLGEKGKRGQGRGGKGSRRARGGASFLRQKGGRGACPTTEPWLVACATWGGEKEGIRRRSRGQRETITRYCGCGETSPESGSGRRKTAWAASGGGRLPPLGKAHPARLRLLEEPFRIYLRKKGGTYPLMALGRREKETLLIFHTEKGPLRR